MLTQTSPAPAMVVSVKRSAYRYRRRSAVLPLSGRGGARDARPQVKYRRAAVRSKVKLSRQSRGLRLRQNVKPARSIASTSCRLPCEEERDDREAHMYRNSNTVQYASGRVV